MTVLSRPHYLLLKLFKLLYTLNWTTTVLWRLFKSIKSCFEMFRHVLEIITGPTCDVVVDGRRWISLDRLEWAVMIFKWGSTELLDCNGFKLIKFAVLSSVLAWLFASRLLTVLVILISNCCSHYWCGMIIFFITAFWALIYQSWEGFWFQILFKWSLIRVKSLQEALWPVSLYLLCVSYVLR